MSTDRFRVSGDGHGIALGLGKRDRVELWPLYQGWRDSLATDRDGVATFTRVTGRAPTVPDADADWRAWVLRTR